MAPGDGLLVGWIALVFGYCGSFGAFLTTIWPSRYGSLEFFVSWTIAGAAVAVFLQVAILRFLNHRPVSTPAFLHLTCTALGGWAGIAFGFVKVLLDGYMKGAGLISVLPLLATLAGFLVGGVYRIMARTNRPTE